MTFATLHSQKTPRGILAVNREIFRPHLTNGKKVIMIMWYQYPANNNTKAQKKRSTSAAPGREDRSPAERRSEEEQMEGSFGAGALNQLDDAADVCRSV